MLNSSQAAAPLIRLATPVDLAAINAIYNYYVLHSTATYQTEPERPADREAWFARHGEKHPVIVVETEGRVVGWGSLSPFHSRAAYSRTVENSIYIHPEFHRRGMGLAILRDLTARAVALGHHVIIAGIDADQIASVALHRREGFVDAAHLREVGFKFGRWLDVIYLQKQV